MNSSSSNPNQNNNQHQNPTPLQKKNSTGGRKKLLTEKIKNKSNRQVTFCKRKGGLVKKASELSTLIGTEIALVVISPTQSAIILPFPKTLQSRYRSCIESVSGDVMFSNLFVKFMKLIKVVIETSCGLGSNVSYRYSLRFGIRGKRFLHLLERTDVATASFVGRKDKIWWMRSVDKLLSLSIELRSK